MKFVFSSACQESTILSTNAAAISTVMDDDQEGSLSGTSLQIMTCRSGESFGTPDGDALVTRNGLNFFNALTNGSGGVICRGAYVLALHKRSEMGGLASHPLVPDECCCVARLESVFTDGEGGDEPAQCSLVSAYFPEDPELADALQGLAAQLGLQGVGAVVPANDRITLPANRIIGLADVGDSHGALRLGTLCTDLTVG